MDENSNPIDPEKILSEDEEPVEAAPEAPEAPEVPETPEAPEASEAPEAPADGGEVVPELDDSLPAVPAAAPARQEAETGKRSRKKPLLIAAAAVAVVVILAVLIASLTRSPLTLVAKGLANTAESVKENSIVSLLGDIAEGGSVELVCGLEDITESLLGTSIDGSASLKLYSSDDPGLALVADVELDGAGLLDAVLVANPNDLALSSEILFGDKTYGVSLKNLAKNFESSVFGPDGEYSLGLEMEDLEKALDPVKNRDTLSKDAAKVYEKAGKALLKSVKAHAEIGKSSQALEFGDETVKTTAVTVSLDAPGLVAVLQDFVEFLRTDKDVRAFLTENADSLAMFSEAPGFYGSYSYDAFGYRSTYGYDDPDQAVDAFYEMLDELAEDLTDLAEEAEDADGEIAFTFYVSKSGDLLVGAEVSADMDGDKTKMSVYAGPDFEKLSEISFRYADSYTTLRGTYTVTERSKNAYTAQLKVREDGQTVFSGEISWDRKAGSLLAEFTDDWGDTYGLKGSMLSSSKTTTITLDSIYTDYEDLDLGVDIILKPSDKMPSVPKYTDLLTMRAEDVEDLAADLYDTAQALMSQLFRLMY